ncbi:enoyl-CoA hydratase/isomerase family protein [Anianabacter salinae]|uniref:enoyl-CoA hydratase/isomerase family protein n=1 Tax=Anianabacter salinae TaxID=2851023 RepID=UPI00225DF9B3|nr:enoyl-CoA hydratase/isomerase family protein [Anianabacter salinae]MBV0911521.1 enoyl-CoA hydratase/isomerase family protein [Anianabacter salinae]
MTDVLIRTEGAAGRITLNRPKSLNALSHPMCLEIEAALDAWRDDPAIRIVIMDAEGEKAFCAGGDIAAMYHAGKAGDFATARNFWREEYRLNAKIFEYPKPIAAFLQGFVMGGGVGLGGHASHRVVGDTSQVAMPECGIGLIPDVGGTLLLARAPGRIGTFLGLTGHRMDAADAIHAGFADFRIPEDRWPDLIARLSEAGDTALLQDAAAPDGDSRLAEAQSWIDAHFDRPVAEAIALLATEDHPLAAPALKALQRNSPLSMAATRTLIARAAEDTTSIRHALTNEYRATWRAIETGDFLEGVRAQIIDKDRTPRWQHAAPGDVADADVAAMLAPLGDNDLNWENMP